MARVSMGDVWDDTKAFVQREAALLFPLAFATVGMASLLLGLAQPEPNARGEMPGGAWMLVLLPSLVLTMLGALAIGALVLRPGGSVREALAEALRHLPGTLLAGLLAGVAMTAVLGMAMLVAALLAVLTGGGAPRAASLSIVLGALPALWVAVRLAALVPLLVSLPPTLAVVPVIRDAFRLTRGHAARIAGVVLIFLVGGGIATLALQAGAGSILLLIGRATGLSATMAIVAEVLMAIAVTVLQAVSLVFQTMLFRRLSARG